MIEDAPANSTPGGQSDLFSPFKILNSTVYMAKIWETNGHFLCPEPYNTRKPCNRPSVWKDLSNIFSTLSHKTQATNQHAPLDHR